ncbi:MAG TPA: nucleotidyltransferase family protein [Gammaproteobacteria bacterium]|nr:nucleotidyltransferase family protein [Gammaproteobacteria bacterium]
MDSPAPRFARGLSCVVLAAGESRRLGAPKQLVRRRMRPLLLRAVDLASTIVGPQSVIVVLGAHALRLRALLRRNRAPVRAVLNARWRDGLASSLQAGMLAVPARSQAVLVLLVDQPNVDARALHRLIDAWRKRPALPAAARYAGHAGVPAILPRSFWPAVHRLRGDVGARALLRDAAQLTLVDTPEAAFDIDTPDDLALLR